VAAAVELQFFDALNEYRSAAELSARLNTDPQLTAALCELLTHMELLTVKEGAYANTPVSEAFLCSRSIYFQQEVIKNISSGLMLWQQLAQICRTGPFVVDQADFFENNLVDSLAAEILTGELQKTIAAVIRQPEFDSARRMLDLGGGHGLYAMALCRHKPALDAVVFDFKPVEKDFRRYQKRFKGEKIHFACGNLFEQDFGRDFDLVLFSYNPGGKNSKVLEKIHACLAPGGLFVSKHAFYRRDEGTKSPLLDMEWGMTAFGGISKKRHIYFFDQDLSYEDYLAALSRNFDIVEIIEAEAFAAPALAKFGDRLDSKIIISRKKNRFKF
jgi:SAM-dependent methyltransferase